jgi:hypothetical protein
MLNVGIVSDWYEFTPLHRRRLENPSCDFRSGNLTRAIASDTHVLFEEHRPPLGEEYVGHEPVHALAADDVEEFIPCRSEGKDGGGLLLLAVRYSFVLKPWPQNAL